MNAKRIGAFLAAAGVALGAFGAHGLQGRLAPEFLEIYKTSTQYLMMHALALVLYGISGIKTEWPGRCFAWGILFFCGSLFALVATGVKALGAITPIGGLLFIAGWIGFGIHARPAAQKEN
ncbi:DUF423 domain-containing protein [bacterium]|jgi:uncharacterized membrane protein YgdD (TMEM256/DUF423 family)|nr:DUF423 domain-containing protein [bacterium]